jgi:redox-sensitive bicupin YhaK (pirin superfamily)
VLRPGPERFHTRLDWLESHHSFSFADHQDPAWMGFGPLRVINEDAIAAGTGFGLHSHREMEILTVMVAGEISHRDSLGHRQRLRAGEVQVMTAGTGIRHSEWNEGAQLCRLLQIWMEPRRRGLAPGYAQKAFAIGPAWTLLADPSAAGGALRLAASARLWRAQPASGAELPVVLPPGSRGWLQLIEGRVTVRGSASLALTAGDGLGFAAGQLAGLCAGDAGADLLLFALL